MKYSLQLLKSFHCKNIGHLHIRVPQESPRSQILFGVHTVKIDTDFEPKYWQTAGQTPDGFTSSDNTAIDITWHDGAKETHYYTVAFCGSEFFIEPKTPLEKDKSI